MNKFILHPFPHKFNEERPQILQIAEIISKEQRFNKNFDIEKDHILV